MKMKLNESDVRYLTSKVKSLLREWGVDWNGQSDDWGAYNSADPTRGGDDYGYECIENQDVIIKDGLFFAIWEEVRQTPNEQLGLRAIKELIENGESGDLKLDASYNEKYHDYPIVSGVMNDIDFLKEKDPEAYQLLEKIFNDIREDNYGDSLEVEDGEIVYNYPESFDRNLLNNLK